MNKFSVFIVGMFALVSSLSVQADASWYAEVAGSFGGDTMAEVEVETFGGDIEDASVKAGEGISLAIGTRMGLSDAVDLTLSAGYKSGGVFTVDGDSASFDRFPLTAMLSFNQRILSFGFGLTQEVDGSLDLKDVGFGKVDVDDALGKFVALNWKITDFFNLGGRYTFIEYELENSSIEYDGNNLAIVASFTF